MQMVRTLNAKLKIVCELYLPSYTSASYIFLEVSAAAPSTNSLRVRPHGSGYTNAAFNDTFRERDTSC